VATTTLTGTTGNNLLNAPGSVSTLVQGLQGNDTITLALVTDEAQAGQGNDSVAFTTSGVAANTISAGDGQDTVWLRGGGQWAGIANLDSGNDSIAIGSAGQLGIINGGQIYGGAGNDTIRLLNVATNATIGGGENSDVLSFSAGAFTNVAVNGGQQADSIFLANAASTFVTVQGGKGFDTITASSGVLGDYTQSSQLAGGQGNDSITLGNALFTSVAGGTGNDTIRGLGNFGSGVIFADSLGTTTGEDGDGADLIAFTAAAITGGAASIYAGGGADTISLSAGNVATGSNLISGGDGSDSIRVGQTTVAFGSIFGGAGNDTIRIAGTASTQISAGQTVISTIYGGAGTDLIIFSATASSLTQQAISAGGTAYNAILSDVSGDTLRLLTGTNFGTANGVSANWSFAGAPVVFVASSTIFTGKSTAFSAGGSAQGSIGVFSDGTDSIIGIYGGGAGSAFNFFRINGIDLTITTVVGQNVALAASNFRFTVAANTGGGMNITFS